MGWIGQRGDTLYLHTLAVAAYSFSDHPDDVAAWERCFAKADELLCRATAGQVRFGRLRITDNPAAYDNIAGPHGFVHPA